ncbi:MAG: OmpA family protein [Hyphomonadaceae bacterium]
MRALILAFAFLAASFAPASAQDATELDRAEQELRDALAPSASAGALLERVAPDEVRMRMPSDITFDFNRAVVRREFLPRIQDVARTLARYPGLAVRVVGHADAIGSDEYNMRLSERRAETIGDMLVRYGVDDERISTSGMGEWEPVASNATEWGRAQNRRVEITIKPIK